MSQNLTWQGQQSNSLEALPEPPCLKTQNQQCQFITNFIPIGASLEGPCLERLRKVLKYLGPIHRYHVNGQLNSDPVFFFIVVFFKFCLFLTRKYVAKAQIFCEGQKNST